MKILQNGIEAIEICDKDNKTIALIEKDSVQVKKPYQMIVNYDDNLELECVDGKLVSKSSS